MLEKDIADIIKAYTAAQIKDASAALRKDGVDGKDGVNGQDGQNGRDGKDGKDGKDGASPDEAAIIEAVALQFERRFSELSLAWERSAQAAIAKALDKMPVPKDGADGKDGKDGLPPESLSIEQDGRLLTVRVGEKSHTIRLGHVLDAGVWDDAKAYEQGDGVTYGGSFWICQEAAPVGAAPGTGCKAWRLAVKRGRDGKDLRDSASKHDLSKGLPI